MKPETSNLKSSASLQRKLALLGESRPLVLATVAQAREQLAGFDEDDIKVLWEDRFLRFVWNIGLGHNTEARLWPDALRHYAATLGSRPYETTEAQVLAELLRTSKPFLTSAQLALLFNCGRDHILNLVEERELVLQPGTSYQPGRNGAALITLASVRAFLTHPKRRLS